MKKILGFAIIALGIFIEVLWLGFVFGSVVIGILLLIFAPRILFFPFNFFLLIGLSVIYGKTYQQAGHFRYQQYNSSSGQGASFANVSNNLDRYYETLESSANDEFSEIKKNYRRLIKEYHYDSIANKNLPDEMLKFAKEKTQDLNEAYAAIKEVKG